MEMFWSNFSRLTGFPAEIFILTLFLTIAGKRNWRRVVIAALAFSLFRLAGEIVKEGFAAERACWQAGVKTLIPCPDSFSFPSGHALGAAMLAMIVSLIHRRKITIVLIWGLALMIAVSRIAVGVHSPIDAMGGIIMGVIAGWIIWKYYWE
jgi:undecaprenyl-diphosphatase